MSSVYPAGIDAPPHTYVDWLQDPPAAPPEAVLDADAVNLMWSALVAIENALGLNPKGAAASVASRIAAVEAAVTANAATAAAAVAAETSRATAAETANAAAAAAAQSTATSAASAAATAQSAAAAAAGMAVVFGV